MGQVNDMVSSFFAILTKGTVRAWNIAYFKKDFIGLLLYIAKILKCLYGQQGFCCFGISIMCKKVF